MENPMAGEDKIECAGPKCKKRFRPGRGWGKYCSAKCGNLARDRRRRAKARKALKFYELHHPQESSGENAETA
jgi:hypothetical protein